MPEQTKLPVQRAPDDQIMDTALKLADTEKIIQDLEARKKAKNDDYNAQLKKLRESVRDLCEWIREQMDLEPLPEEAKQAVEKAESWGDHNWNDETREEKTP